MWDWGAGIKNCLSVCSFSLFSFVVVLTDSGEGMEEGEGEEGKEGEEKGGVKG